MVESKWEESWVGRKQGWTKTGWTKTGWTKMNRMKSGSTIILLVFLLSVRKQLKTIFHNYLQMKLKYISGITEKYIGTYFIL